MKKSTSTLIFFLLFFQISFSQKMEDIKYAEATEAFENNDFKTVVTIIQELRKQLKTERPKYLSLEILAKAEIIKNDPFDDFSLIANTRILANQYLKNVNSQKDSKYALVVWENNILNSYPKDLASFNLIKKEKQEQIALEKELLAKEELIAKEKAEAERIKKIETEKQNSLITDRKNRLSPYVNVLLISDYELAQISETEFNVKLDKAIKDSILKNKEDQRLKEIENQRRAKLQPYKYYVNYYDNNNISTFTEVRFEEIYQQAKKDAKVAAKRDKPQLRPFSSLGIQSGEVAKYGLIYERGGRRTIGFRLSARSSLIPEEDILNGKQEKNKTEIEIGPNIKLFKRIYINLGAGYGYYDKVVNNDYANTLILEKRGYIVATSGLMIRVSRVININGGVSFIDIDKDFYRPEITFGMSFNLKKR